MHGTWTDGGVRVAGDGRQQFHDARGYGTPLDNGGLELAPIEAAHLLYRGDIESVDGKDFPAFFREMGGTDRLTEFIVYKDFRERGYYLRPAPADVDATFTVLERGSGPTDDTVAYRVRVIDERDTLAVDHLRPGVLAIVDDEAEVGYVAVDRREPTGTAPTPSVREVPADLVGRRVLVWESPRELYSSCFFGQPVGGRDAIDDALQLSLIEACYLAERDVIAIDGGSNRVRKPGRTVGGADFDRRYGVYESLREAGTVPKTGYKFGADFRVYRSFQSLEEMGHSDLLVRVVDPTRQLSPQAIALDVRLAHGVGKRMVFARRDGSDDPVIDWLSIERLTP